MESQLREAEAPLPRLMAAQAEIESKIDKLLVRFRTDATAQLTDVRAELQRSTLEFESNVDRLDHNIASAAMAGFVNRMCCRRCWP